MFISEPQTFYDSVKPLAYFNCFVGMGAVRLPNQSNAWYAFMKVHTVTFTLLNWFMIYTTMNSLDLIVDSEYTSPMAIMMNKILICVNSCIAVMAPLVIWFRRKGLRDCGLRMTALDDTFENCLGAPKEYRRQYIRLIWKISAMFSVMILVSICDILTVFEIVQHLGIRSLFTLASVMHALHHPILIVLLLDVNFCFFIGYLERKFRDVNNCLLRLTDVTLTTFHGGRLFTMSQNFMKMRSQNIIQNTGSEDLINDKHRSLRQIRKAHLELCKLSRKINIIFGIQNLISTGISFVMITGLSYTIYSALERRNGTLTILKEVIPSIIWTAIHVFKVWMVNHSCYCVTNENEKTGEVIYELLGMRIDEVLQTEVLEFGVQMLQNPVHFNACGFFTLDYTFVQGVIGSVTTYLVILIQMSHISESPDPDTTLAVNNKGISVHQLINLYNTSD